MLDSPRHIYYYYRDSSSRSWHSGQTVCQCNGAWRDSRVVIGDFLVTKTNDRTGHLEHCHYWVGRRHPLRDTFLIGSGKHKYA